MPYQFIQVEEKDGVLSVTMDDPRTRNALGPEMSKEINEVLDRLEADASLRVLLLTGRDPAFCSGANVRGFQRGIEQREQAAEALPPPTPWEHMEKRYALKLRRGEAQEERARFLPLRLWETHKPTIAAVNGYAMGVGLGLALSCDIRIASEKAGFSEAFIRMGLIPADGSCWQLPRLIGLSNTFLMQYTGDIIPAQDAYRLGLVSRVVAHEELPAVALEIAQRLAQGPTYGMGLIKYLVHNSLTMDFKESLEMAGAAQELARQTEDHKEGVRAFLEKRKPAYKGR
ncbi:MAG: enoyl-CoA hydratase/isomerase family protein [Chloroflexi bacterium]|nr:enoyl-CoA hydratase/isomerase family protein [Chloroflexota bacterium]